MGIASKFNKNVINWNVETEGLTYVKASELEIGKVYPFLGCWITPDKGYGEGGVIITEIDGVKKLVNTPNSFTGTITLIRRDEESIEAIKNSKLAFKVEEFDTKFKRKGYGIKLVDIE